MYKQLKHARLSVCGTDITSTLIDIARHVKCLRSTRRVLCVTLPESHNVRCSRNIARKRRILSNHIQIRDSYKSNQVTSSAKQNRAALRSVNASAQNYRDMPEYGVTVTERSASRASTANE